MRVVLDTNTLVSAFLFSGTASRLVDLWQSGRITVLISKEILGEYLLTGDRDLRDLGSFRRMLILTIGEFFAQTGMDRPG